MCQGVRVGVFTDRMGWVGVGRMVWSVGGD